jgi:alkaline phosphatase
MRARILFLMIGLIVPLGTSAQDAPRNVILFISDGCGPASFTLAREYLRYKEAGPLALDGHMVGSISTFAADTRVTDSAASGTAMACGVKTSNGAIAVDTAGRPVATILEAAERRGMATGLVVTSTISHATPAVFSAHVPSRGDQPEIARQQLEQGIEVMFGGGEEFYLPEPAGGRRNDAVNLFDLAAEKGYQIARNRDEFLAFDRTPALAIFGPGQMTLEIDRDPTEEPSLEEMTRKAIELLDDEPDGFFLMVEGSRIDHAAHANDVAAHLHEILQFDAAVAVALEFAKQNGNTLIAATSDHETGGMSLGRTIGGRSVYSWWPEVIDRVPASHGGLVQMADDRGVGICDVLSEDVDISCTAADEAELARADSAGVWQMQAAIGEIISRAAGVGWTTGGHTAVDVNMYAYGPAADHFIGHHDNTAVGLKIAEIMGFDLDALTQDLRAGAP